MLWMNTRKLLARGVLGFMVLSIVGPLSFSQDKFACTEVLGFSQTWQWFTGKGMEQSRGNMEIPENAFRPDWQGRFEFGAALDRWSNQDFRGWEGTFRSIKMCPREEVDRVVFNISGTAREASKWAQDISKVVDVLKQKYPNVRQIVLQPVVGAEEGKCTDVRAARIHPLIVKAIEEIAAESDEQQIVGGATPKVTDCSHYADKLGHLSPEGAINAHKLLSEYYSRMDEVSQSEQ